MSAKDERETPADLFHALHGEFRFTLDAAASHVNHKVDHYCTLEGFFWRGRQVTGDNGLAHMWQRSDRVWLNPPFSRLMPWVEKAWREPAGAVVMLLPNNRQEQPFWQDMIEPYRDRPGSPLSTRFLAGRRHFTVDGGKPIMQQPRVSKRTGKPLKQTRSSAEFGLVLCIWDRRLPGGITRSSLYASGFQHPESASKTHPAG